MSSDQALQRVAGPLGETVKLTQGLKVVVKDLAALGAKIEPVVHTAVFAKEPDRNLARWLIRECALQAGVVPSSIHDLYLARGRGETRNDFSVPALNLRALPFHAAKAAFRAAERGQSRAIIFEIARSEIGYTDQRPAEYAACVLGAALAEGYQGPVFIQGDHFQVSASRYASDMEAELADLKALMDEALKAGFYNIDIDTSTLVDLSWPTVSEQQAVNFALCAQLSAHVRSKEPGGITTSIGGEIGEVGKHNSTVEELRAFMEGFNLKFGELMPGAVGLSKISVQTGTSHGGVVLPDGSIADAKVDFETLQRLSQVAREDYGMAGAVQHGASTLPEEAFSHFPTAETCEVHLATNFMNILYNLMPGDLRAEAYAYLEENHLEERKPDQTAEQFYYKTRKRALGPFKSDIWNMPAGVVAEIEGAWEKQFSQLFESLNVTGTSDLVARHVQPVPIHVSPDSYVSGPQPFDEPSDLAD